MSATDRLTNLSASAISGEKALRLWVIALSLLVLVMVTIGGATRLTGSGLSITEWKPISGAIPPLDAATWAAEFERYKQIPQYKLQNAGISLEEFKPLFWWEWGHRQLGRFIGLVYVLGFFTLLAMGYLRGRILAFTALGLLLGTQATIGWVMVSSGLEAGMVAVAPIKLALHLTLACVFFAGLIAMLAALCSKTGRAVSVPPRLRFTTKGLVVLVFVQIALGALVAGNKAGHIYNTWPLIDGAFIPGSAGLFFEQPWWRNFLDNHLMVQFVHRMSAYLLLGVAVWHGLDAIKLAPQSQFSRNAVQLAGLVFLQGAMGVITLLLVVPLWAGLLHQGMAVLVLGFAVWHAARGISHLSANQHLHPKA